MKWETFKGRLPANARYMLQRATHDARLARVSNPTLDCTHQVSVEIVNAAEMRVRMLYPECFRN